jgi:NAD(P)-dependent dehydrogenase (short-subunit alcohol dehydrogenase family)
MGALAGKIAVVTGASRGIGRAIAAAFVDAGASVAACALGPSRGFLDDVADSGGSFLVHCDVRDRAAVLGFRDETLARLGVPDLIVNNAGIVVRSRFVDLSESDWHAVLGANLHGTFLVTQAFLPAILARGTGARIINVASIAGRQGTPMLSAYCTAKHGVVGLTRSLAEELRPNGIQVNAICPGSVDTDMLKIGMPGGAPRMAPMDIAKTALFLAAEAPPALTGACIDVFG